MIYMCKINAWAYPMTSLNQLRMLHLETLLICGDGTAIQLRAAEMLIDDKYMGVLHILSENRIALL